MKHVMRRAGGSDALLLWFACVAALCAGFYIAFGVLGAAIDLQHSRTGRISALMLADAEIAGQWPELARQERTITGRLAALQLHADTSATVARFIRGTARVAASRHVDLVEIDQRAAVAPPATVPLAAAESAVDINALEAIPLDVTLSGTYRALLATICELAQVPLTMHIEIASIERDSSTAGNAPGGPLTARLRVDLQRLSDPLPPVPRPTNL
jgi:hypothetical protein